MGLVLCRQPTLCSVSVTPTGFQGEFCHALICEPASAHTLVLQEASLLDHSFEPGSPTNPTVVTSPPKAEHKERKTLDEGETQLFLITSKTKADRYSALYQLALTTGMRQGELLGLKWKDINWDRKMITVQ